MSLLSVFARRRKTLAALLIDNHMDILDSYLNLQQTLTNIFTMKLFTPNFDTISHALRTTLQQNFKIVSVDFVPCPDLRMFGFAAPGLCGNTTILEIGNRHHLFPIPQYNKRYPFADLLRILNRENNCNFIIGAGKHSCPPKYNIAEFFANVYYMPLSCTFNGETKICNNSCATWWNKRKDKTEILEGVNPTCSMHGNFFLSNGDPGLIYRIEAHERIGPHDFISSIQRAIKFSLPHQMIGLGGVFIARNDSMYHVTPSFSTSSIDTIEQAQQWLRYNKYTDCTFLAAGIILNASEDIFDHYYYEDKYNLYNITTQHFHSYSQSALGGHIYNNDGYYDNSTDEVSHYIGYFSVAEKLSFWNFENILTMDYEYPALDFVCPK